MVKASPLDSTRNFFIYVVGVGLEGRASLPESLQKLIDQADLLVGSARHLSYFPTWAGDRLLIQDFTTTLQQLRAYLDTPRETPPIAVILASGDPLFFGLGRLLLAEFAPESLIFHPHVSSVQLAFSRLRLPWQEAEFVSIHGRSIEALVPALQQGTKLLAVLTDSTNTPAAIAKLVRSLQLPLRYRLSVCENLGGDHERITSTTDLLKLEHEVFDPLNVVVLQRIQAEAALELATLPLFGIGDDYFLSFPDRPGLMTKCEVRVQILAALALQPQQVVWDIGAGTGSVAIEIGRLCPSSDVYAIEKTAVGYQLIQQNCDRFQVKNVTAVQGEAPIALQNLPAPHRVFIGGSSGKLPEILSLLGELSQPPERVVVAIATLEHQAQAITWLRQDDTKEWRDRWLQIDIARSVPVANLTRMAPLNPVSLLVLERWE
ncbi:MAG TPA: precorrin-6y C5,15-methyltransferase (decarboxylating) subunit CbiE [Leptolyngbyaceae cyanobacterium M33_DOE_097]|uniref:Precorrin-6y C5,15-methyltransferase (Decarboxylating) subunit CbiE n=1 Tax=Oscillatoriales cyanobacterium SpSt-418 TaxID=2282169 RepID=A0A7C3PEF8_9CYAN|nr:precorrin-6y C5,15-methyltransferase (decarboxylating) subunit CbiE [Leptolyngbyaceae cyanobacterium M33_DOE_097]